MRGLKVSIGIAAQRSSSWSLGQYFGEELLPGSVAAEGTENIHRYTALSLTS